MMYAALFFLGIAAGIGIADMFAGKDYPQRHHAIAIMQLALICAFVSAMDVWFHRH